MSLDDVNFNTLEARIAKEVALQFISEKVGRHTKNEIRKEVEILLRLSDEINNEFGGTINDMCNKLDVRSENACARFSVVAKEILNDNENWGRIIVIFAFAAELAIKCKQIGMEQMIEQIICWLSCFIGKRANWIRSSGKGWVNMFLV